MAKRLLQSLILCSFILCISQSIFSQAPADTAAKKTIATIELPDSIKKLPARVTSLEKKNSAAATSAKDTTGSPCTTCAVKCGIDAKNLGFVSGLLIFLPVILFFVVVGFFIHLILKGKFDLAETLSTGKPQPESTITTADGITTQTTKPVGSTSRLIAFLTGITAILIAICLITYYAYFTLAGCSGNMKFDEMWKILAGLGIGIIPYGINVWKGNNKEADTKPDNNA